MPKTGPLGILKSFCIGGLFALLLGGGYNLVSGSPTAPKAAVGAIVNMDASQIADDDEEASEQDEPV